MNLTNLTGFTLFLILLSANFSAFSQEKVPLIILCDPGCDPSNEQSIVRLLAFSNQLDIRGICLTGESDSRKNLEIAQNCILAYSQVYAKLSMNENNYPSPEGLVDRIKSGKNFQGIGNGQDSRASDWIITCVDQISDKIWICIWDGQRELAQALWKIKTTRNLLEQNEFIRKIRIHAINDKDHYRKWILENFPQIFYIADGSLDFNTDSISNNACYLGQYLQGAKEYQDQKWIYRNIINNHGPLGRLYPLFANGVNGMKETGTPTFMGLIDNGLNCPNYPGWGGFGGRFKKVINNYYVCDKDFYDKTTNEPNTVARWRSYMQNDFNNRMNWCVKDLKSANHPPQIKVNIYSNRQIIELNASTNNHLKIDASETSDPDGDKLFFKWWFYKDASDYLKDIDFKLSHSDKKLILLIPSDATGKILHLILEVSDSGQPSLTSFKRFVIHCK